MRHCAARGSPRLRAVRYRGGRTTRNAIVALQRPIAIRVRGLKARRVAGIVRAENIVHVMRPGGIR